MRLSRDLAFVVRLAARPLPDATCLRQALVLRYLLARRGVVASVRLGTRNEGATATPRLGFHAWVEVDDEVVSESAASIAAYVVLEMDPGS